MNVTEIAILSVIAGFAKSIKDIKDKKFNVLIFLKSFLLFFVALLAIDLLVGQFVSTDTRENSGEENIIWLIGGIILFILFSFARKMFVRR